LLRTPNEPGTARQLTRPLAQEHANILTLWAGNFDGQGWFHLITDDNKKAIKALRENGFTDVEEREYIVVQRPDQVGSCDEVARKISDAGLDFEFFYTTIFKNQPAIVFSTNDNQRAVDLF